MLPLETLNLIEAILNSDTVSVKGSQLNLMFNILQQIAQEKQRLIVASRLTPVNPVSPQPDATNSTPQVS